MPENPNAESPSRQSILFRGEYFLAQNAAAIANPGPTPMVPNVPASRRCRGESCKKIDLPISIVLAPSLTTKISKKKKR